MICPACKYEHEEEFVHEHGARFYKTTKGDDPFIHIEGHFTITKEYDYHPSETMKVNLYSCPKCGCVRTDSIDYL